MIPKILHQTWWTDDLGELLQKRVGHNKQQNPTWDYKFWTDDDIENWLELEGHVKDLERFKAIQVGPAKADLFRLIVLYYMGGVYMDLDNVLTKPIDEWLHDEAPAMVSLNGLRRVDFCLVGCEPGNTYIKKTLEKVRSKIDQRVDGSALHVTGPPNWRHANRRTREPIQIVGLAECLEPGYERREVIEKEGFALGGVGTPKLPWVGSKDGRDIECVLIRSRKPWSQVKAPDGKPSFFNWQKMRRRSLYHDD